MVLRLPALLFPVSAGDENVEPPVTLPTLNADVITVIVDFLLSGKEDPVEICKIVEDFCTSSKYQCTEETWAFLCARAHVPRTAPTWQASFFAWCNELKTMRRIDRRLYDSLVQAFLLVSLGMPWETPVVQRALDVIQTTVGEPFFRTVRPFVSVLVSHLQPEWRRKTFSEYERMDARLYSTVRFAWKDKSEDSSTFDFEALLSRVQEYLSEGANPDAQGKLQWHWDNGSDPFGPTTFSTALNEALRFDDLRLAEVLLAAGARSIQPDGHPTTLFSSPTRVPAWPFWDHPPRPTPVEPEQLFSRKLQMVKDIGGFRNVDWSRTLTFQWQIPLLLDADIQLPEEWWDRMIRYFTRWWEEGTGDERYGVLDTLLYHVRGQEWFTPVFLTEMLDGDAREYSGVRDMLLHHGAEEDS